VSKRKRREEEEEKKVGKKDKKHPNSGVKLCLRCGKEFMSLDVCRNRICTACGRANYREWLPNVYNSGPGIEAEDNF
jgi:hypothetical protein